MMDWFGCNDTKAELLKERSRMVWVVAVMIVLVVVGWLAVFHLERNMHTCCNWCMTCR